MALGDVLQGIGDFAGAFATRGTIADIRQARQRTESQDLERNLRRKILDKVAASDRFDPSQSRELRSLAALNPPAAEELARVTGGFRRSRLRARSLDSQTASRLLKAGQFGGAIDFLNDRIGAVTESNGDPSETQGILNQVMEIAQNQDGPLLDDVIDTLDANVQFGVERDLIAGPKPEKFIETTKAGQAIVQTARGIEARDIPGLTPIRDLEAGLPKKLLQDLSPNVRGQATEAFKLAGGGKDGLKAFNEVVETAKVTTRREDVPQILDASFPRTSPAERAQLDAVMQAATNVDSGLKQADKIRTEQRRLKKAQGFQRRAIDLLTNIIGNDQLGDIVGSIEGAIDFRFTDVESELIADIDEAQNILTAENMDLMTGVLSESDIKLLKNLSSGALNRKRSEKRFRADAQSLLDKLSSALVQTVDDQPPGTQQAGTQSGRFTVEVIQ